MRWVSVPPHEKNPKRAVRTTLQKMHMGYILKMVTHKNFVSVKKFLQCEAFSETRHVEAVDSFNFATYVAPWKNA